MRRILLAEDNANMRELICDYLSANGYEVDAAADGEEAWEMIQTSDYALALLDVMMPRMNGFTLCKKIRQRENLPILFITAKVSEADQLRGYQLGADDYILKPFSLAVLLAKCKAILEREKRGSEWIEVSGIRLEPERRLVECGGEFITLQALDFDLLYYFMRNAGKVLTRDQILVKLWGYDYEGSDRAVDTHVKNLRKALGKYGACIRTVIKQGYVMEREPEE
ncbi:MAG: response regulator transcription factor [Clostridiales bacterium]|nr:response regulator transcription factor [Clostridiales bacterium]